MILQSQLSKQNSMGQNLQNPHAVPQDEFWEMKKEAFLE